MAARTSEAEWGGGHPRLRADRGRRSAGASHRVCSKEAPFSITCLWAATLQPLLFGHRNITTNGVTCRNQQASFGRQRNITS